MIAAEYQPIGRMLLIAAGALDAIAAAAHVTVIFGGPAWYRFFGAGERMARMAERGDLYPTIVTLVIVAVLSSWVAFAWSGAGMLPRLPLLRTALLAICAVYLVRGVLPFAIFAVRPALTTPFWLWSSAIVFGYAIVHIAGVVLSWPTLAPRG